MNGELEYPAVVTVGVDLEAGEVDSVIVRAATADNERVELSVSFDSEQEQPDEVHERAQQIVDARAPFELAGWRHPPERCGEMKLSHPAGHGVMSRYRYQSGPPRELRRPLVSSTRDRR
jgi:hypothetical protein